MSSKRISEMDAAAAFNLTDIVPIVDANGSNKKVTGAQVKAINEFHVGDVVDLTPGSFVGVVAGTAKKALRITFPLNKPLGSDITGVSFPGNFTLYTSAGAEIVASPLASIGTINSVYIRDYGITVYLTLTNAISGNNDTPVVLYANGGCTLVFT